MTTTITAQEARALRHADSLCFDHKDGAGAIRAIRSSDKTSTGFEETVTIALGEGLSRVNDYSGTDGPVVGFAMIMSAQYDQVARTLVRHIRTGSQVGFLWTRDNNSPVTREAGIVVDMLDVKVQNGKTCDTFRVSTYIGYDNTARMVRRG